MKHEERRCQRLPELRSPLIRRDPITLQFKARAAAGRRNR